MWGRVLGLTRDFEAQQWLQRTRDLTGTHIQLQRDALTDMQDIGKHPSGLGFSLNCLGFHSFDWGLKFRR